MTKTTKKTGTNFAWRYVKAYIKKLLRVKSPSAMMMYGCKYEYDMLKQIRKEKKEKTK